MFNLISPTIKKGVVNGTKKILNEKSKSVKVSPKEVKSAGEAVMGVAGVVVGSILGLNMNRMPDICSQMSLKDINTHFKDIFLNDELSIGETQVMLDRYKKLDYIADDEEYVKAVFKEAKHNYGLDKLESELVIKDTIGKNGQYNVDGYADPLGNVTIAMKDRTRGQLFNSIHHELRHVKQRYYAFNMEPEKYVEFNQPKNSELPLEMFRYMFGGKPSVKNIPKSQQKYAERCTKEMFKYVSANKDVKKYSNQYLEQDAYNAGNRISLIMRIYRARDLQVA